MMRTQPWVIAYDVADDRQRTRLHELLSGFGEAVQRSVFLCHLDGRRKAYLLTLLRREVLAAGDRLDLFLVSGVETLGPSREPAALEGSSFIIME